MIENNFFTESCAANDIYWAGFTDVHKQESISAHIYYCPRCGKRLPRRKNKGRDE